MTTTNMKNANYLKNTNKLLSADQYGFRANDSYANQLLSIVHDINTAFNAYPTLKSRGFFSFFFFLFLNMSKTFDKVLHEGLIFRLKSMYILDALLELIKRYLAKSVVPNGQTSGL